MRIFGLLPGILTLVLSAGAFAQVWAEFTSIEDRFMTNFPGTPTLENIMYTTEDGPQIPARRWSARKGQEYYAVTVVNFAPHYDFWEPRIWSSMAHAATQFRRTVPMTRDITYDAQMRMNRVPGHALQINKQDGGRLFVLIVLHQDPMLDTRRLYIVEAHVPSGAPPPGLFQQAFGVTNPQGEMIRYTNDGREIEP
jgi:hypothetical protein